MEAQKKEMVEAIKHYVVPEDCIIVKDECLKYHTKCRRCAFYYSNDFMNWECDWCSKLICRDCFHSYCMNEDIYIILIFCNDECESKYRAKKKKQKTLLNRLK